MNIQTNGFKTLGLVKNENFYELEDEIINSIATTYVLGRIFEKRIEQHSHLIVRLGREWFRQVFHKISKDIRVRP